jgi:hypothetical protein
VIFNFDGTYRSRSHRLREEISRPDLNCLYLALALMNALSEVPRLFFS